jgi:CheY-like chemotaxis protein
VALTAHAHSEDHARAIHAGFQAHLAKPVDPDRLISTLTDLRR